MPTSRYGDGRFDQDRRHWYVNFRLNRVLSERHWANDPADSKTCLLNRTRDMEDAGSHLWVCATVCRQTMLEINAADPANLVALDHTP